eukprot:scaffold568_cov376-Prasinococcus_capsulatus_cf.AAC.7
MIAVVPVPAQASSSRICWSVTPKASCIAASVSASQEPDSTFRRRCFWANWAASAPQCPSKTAMQAAYAGFSSRSLWINGKRSSSTRVASSMERRAPMSQQAPQRTANSAAGSSAKLSSVSAVMVLWSSQDAIRSSTSVISSLVRVAHASAGHPPLESSSLPERFGPRVVRCEYEPNRSVACNGDAGAARLDTVPVVAVQYLSGVSAVLTNDVPPRRRTQLCRTAGARVIHAVPPRRISGRVA